MVESSEKSGKEQYFGDNKKNYSITEAFLDSWGMVPLEGAFSDLSKMCWEKESEPELKSSWQSWPDNNNTHSSVLA